MARRATLWTAARLVAAALLMAAGAAIVPFMISLYPDERWDRDQRELTYLFVGVGWYVGWFGLGQKVNKDLGSGIGLGLRAVLTMCAWILGLLSIWYGIRRMRQHAYWEPMEAILDMFNKLTEYFVFLMNWQLLGVIAVVGMIVGSMTEGAAKRWK